jgi:hypothetical protein
MSGIEFYSTAADVRLATDCGSLAAVSKNDKITEVAAKHPQLYSRKAVSLYNNFDCASAKAGKDDDLKEQDSFSVKQFNLLAEELSSSPLNAPVFSTAVAGKPIAPSSYGGFDSIGNCETVFNFNSFRKWKLLEEILQQGTEPDIH